MKNRSLLLFASVLVTSSVFLIARGPKQKIPDNVSVAVAQDGNEEENEVEYESLTDRFEQEFQMTKDPNLGYVPKNRLVEAAQQTKRMRSLSTGKIHSLSWTERGPIFDSTGPSSGNPRGGGGYTSGIVQTFLIDTITDPTGNTVFAGTPSGGLWRCTNLLSSNAPNWQPVNDFMANLAIASICRNPSAPNIMYIATGDANTRDVRGNGIWKSTDYGQTWSLLPSTTTFRFSFKILCDADGNVYDATGGSGLQRSTDGGNSWTLISPSGLTVSNPTYVPDIEISSNGRLHACFGYYATSAMHYYADNPSTVTSASGWNTSWGIRLSGTPLSRIEFATQGNTMYAITVTANNAPGSTFWNMDSCYKSTDDGATWSKQNATLYTSGLGSNQGWYAITLKINPDDATQFITGGLDAYKSTNSGSTITRQTFWVTGVPYVHADHHCMEWWKEDGESRVLIACDGGLFLSRDGGVTWKNKNENLAIKQFYSCAIYPTAGSNFIFAGAQDNGCHQIKTPGKTYSYETTGGDGAFVHINQQTPAIQFGTYVYNQYRRSTDGGQTWTSVNLSSTTGFFINPFDYDDAQNIMYASDANTAAPNNQIRRWASANTGSASTTIVLSELLRSAANSNASAFKVSPYTANRVFIGGSTGKLLRLNNANTVTTANETTNVTDLTGASFPNGYINCINIGSSEQYMVVTFTNYGVNNVWYTSDGGTTWTAIDGNLPDMPVRWAVFEPGRDDKLILATESGVYSTQAVLGASTVWTPNPGFPIVRTNMLKIRPSDNTIVAATYGRGLWSAQLPNSTTPEINFTTAQSTVTEQSNSINSCRNYRDYIINVGLANAASGDATVNLSVQAGATATQGLDYDFTTNGDFTTPSSQLSFLSGSTGIKPVTIRIYDDALIEPTETFTLTFSISGTTTAVAGSTTTHVFTINGNDFVPKVNTVNSYAIGGAYDVNMTATSSAFASNVTKNRVQYLFYASELKAAGIYTAASLNSMTVRVATKNSTKPFTGLNVSMANTGTTTLNSGFAPEALTTVYSGNYSTVAGDNVIAFSTPFAWDGNSNIVVQFCFDNTASGADVAEDVMEGNSAPLPANYRASAYANSGAGAGCSMAAAFISYARINASFTATFGNDIASVLSTSRNEYINTNGTYYFYTSAGEILNSITSASANLGCVSSTILEAGNTWQSFLGGQRSQKVFTITPSSNPGSSYTVSLYYTLAELGGKSPANLKIAKTSSATMAGANSGNTIFGTTNFTPFGSGYLFTASFTGFSNFFLADGNVILPVMLLTFEGHLDKSMAILQWSTSAEQNSKNFDVEKSEDGIHYFKIGSVAGAGNTTEKRSYTFTDTKLNQNNYYRLRINNINGENKLSQVVFLAFNASKQNVWVVNNPFNSYIDLRFGKIGSEVKLQLINMNGAVVAEKNITSPSGQIRWDLPGQLSNGSYVLKTIVDKEIFTNKIVKQ